MGRHPPTRTPSLLRPECVERCNLGISLIEHYAMSGHFSTRWAHWGNAGQMVGRWLNLDQNSRIKYTPAAQKQCFKDLFENGTAKILIPNCEGARTHCSHS